MAICFCQDHHCYLNIYCPPLPLQIREQGKILKNTYCGWTDWSSCWTTWPAISACRVRLSDVVFSTIHVLSRNLKVSPKLPLPASPWIKIHLPRIYSEWKNIQLGSERFEYGYNFWYFTSVCHCNCFLMKLQTIAAFNELQKLKKRKRYCISCCEITATFLHCLTFRISNVYNITISSWIKCCLSVSCRLEQPGIKPLTFLNLSRWPALPQSSYIHLKETVNNIHWKNISLVRLLSSRVTPDILSLIKLHKKSWTFPIKAAEIQVNQSSSQLNRVGKLWEKARPIRF